MNLAVNLPFFVLASQNAAIACFDHVGTGDKVRADDVATEAMRNTLNNSPIDARVVIGEGEMDEAPMLYIGERLGLNPMNNQIDIAVDPLEGTNLCAQGLSGAMTTIAFAGNDCILNAPDIYMEKLIVTPGFGDYVSLDNDIKTNVQNLAMAKNCNISDIKIIMLQRDRHKQMIDDARSIGAKVILITDGDIGASLNVLIGNADMYVGSGGSPEGILTAAAAKGFKGGNMFGRLTASSEDDKKRMKSQFGITDFDKIYTIDDMVKGECYFIASGVTSGDILEGVSKNDNWNVSTLIISSEHKSINWLTSDISK